MNVALSFTALPPTADTKALEFYGAAAHYAQVQVLEVMQDWA